MQGTEVQITALVLLDTSPLNKDLNISICQEQIFFLTVCSFPCI